MTNKVKMKDIMVNGLNKLTTMNIILRMKQKCNQLKNGDIGSVPDVSSGSELQGRIFEGRLTVKSDQST